MTDTWVDTDSRPEEPLWYLKSLPYSSYLTTLHWTRLATRLKDERGHKCQVCGFYKIDSIEVHGEVLPTTQCEGVKRDGYQCQVFVTGWRTCSKHRDQSPDPFAPEEVIFREDRAPMIVVHHLTYARLGEEWDEDLLVTCQSCNYYISYPDASSSRYWFMCAQGSTVTLETKQRKLTELVILEASETTGKHRETTRKDSLVDRNDATTRVAAGVVSW